MADVAAIIGNYQGREVLADCLTSLASQTHLPAEVIVVDAGSGDGSPELARAAGATVVTTENRGIGHLYNVGVRSTRWPLVFLANNDVALEPTCLELLQRELAADDRLFACDPRQRDWDDGRDIHRRSTITRGPLFRQPLPGFRIDQNVAGDTVARTMMANGAAFLVRRDRFLELGGFDETFFMEWEDTDLSWRAWLSGWEIAYVPDAVVRHRVGAVTTPALRPRRIRSSHHNLVRFALKCFPARAAGRVVLGELLRLPAHPALIAPALVEVAREAPAIIRERRRLAPARPTFDRLYGSGGPVG